MEAVGPNRMDTVVSKCKHIANLWKEHYISQLPGYAWAYEEGEKYIRTHFMVEIENQTKSIYIKCLENGGNFELPPTK